MQVIVGAVLDHNDGEGEVAVYCIGTEDELEEFTEYVLAFQKADLREDEEYWHI